MAAAAAALVIAGCQRLTPPSAFETCWGRVEDRNLENGEWSVRVTQSRQAALHDHVITCVVTKDSEIYVNDLLRPIDAVQVGDDVQVVLYAEAAGPERYVVSTAQVRKDLPPPPLPKLAGQ
ncbi:hypothetical protein RAS1_39200 [Phycisphaerae bacterium RAS1]|nr:hypothetical protein RAS1_39200 [Phycisphaerae bacterium RAS1]